MDNTQALFTLILNQVEKTQAVVGNIEHDGNAQYAELRSQLASVHAALEHLARQLAILNKTVLIGNGLSHQGMLVEHTGRLAAVEAWKRGMQDRLWKVVFAGALPLLVTIGAVAVALYRLDAIQRMVSRLFASGL